MFRTINEAKELKMIKNDSHKSQSVKKIVIQNRKKREFFCYENGVLQEFDCSKYKGYPIQLTEEEIQVIKNGSFQ